MSDKEPIELAASCIFSAIGPCKMNIVDRNVNKTKLSHPIMEIPHWILELLLPFLSIE